MISTEEEISQKYQRKTDKQHVLDNPNMYIGSIEQIDSDMWIYDEQQDKIVQKKIDYIPALYKLFDEVIVNSRDHVIRMIQSTADNKTNVSFIKVTIAKETGEITIMNDGDGIDVVKHTEYDMYIPELVFANLRTSTNYNKDEKRIVGGVNGLGVKLVFIWSKYARVETVDHRRGLKYIQEFHNNLETIDPPKITKFSGKPYTQISFLPDYERLGLMGGGWAGIPDNFFRLLQKRVYDIAGITDHHVKKIKVHFNGTLLGVKNFKDYLNKYIDTDSKRVYEENGERWEYAVALSPTDSFEQVSFVNGIATTKGGKHVEYIMGQVTRKLAAIIEKKKKIVVSPNTIKEQLFLFLRCDIENPSFDSQSKECMNSPFQKFGSTCTVSDAFIEKLSKMGIIETVCALTEMKENRNAKKTDGVKTKHIRGINNFIDANHAGTAKSNECILILCEGLSAMTGVVSGLSKPDRDIYGIYPLRGKLLNVRGENIKRITENREITDLKKILGLETGKVYESIEDVYRCLRYGKIMFLTDADCDGHHIKGLCVNLIQSEWSSLFRISGFLCFMNTPILKASYRNRTLVFYNEGEYNAWKLDEPNWANWKIKYFKGLGTSTPAEFKEYFACKKLVNFVYEEGISDDVIDKVFNKKRADERKTWLENYDRNSYLNTSLETVKYDDFINKELIHFSVADCQRSIPNIMDGLKTSQRKILYCAFKRKLVHEIKVAQFSGYVSENSAYHHGENSLNKAIVGLAQNFVGSNNIHLFQPKGQFGSMLHGGEDHASERYIFTHLSPIARHIFMEQDDPILRYLEEDGVSIEPDFYAPVIPFVLINGQNGIGTGFSTYIPPYHPLQVIAAVRHWITNGGGIKESDMEFVPYFWKFKGTVSAVPANSQKFLIQGVYRRNDKDDKVHIRELPIGTWTMPYITYLEGLMESTEQKGAKIPPVIKQFVSHSTEVDVDIVVQFPKNTLANYTAENLEKVLKINTTISTTNMHLFDKDCKLQKFHHVCEIIHYFCTVRKTMYEARKKYYLDELERIYRKTSNKVRFIQELLDDAIDLRKKTTEMIVQILRERGYDEIEDSFDYLVKMPMNVVSLENTKKMLDENEKILKELNDLKEKSVQQLWMDDLGNLERIYRQQFC